MNKKPTTKKMIAELRQARREDLAGKFMAWKPRCAVKWKPKRRRP
jgi:hypothetical protein